MYVNVNSKMTNILIDIMINYDKQISKESLSQNKHTFAKDISVSR